MTNFEMLFGEFPYEEMYEANSTASAAFFFSFVFVFSFFVMNMYTAIIIRTYQKLREQKLALSEAMATILFRTTKKKA